MNDAATPAPRADGHAARRRGTRAQVIEAAVRLVAERGFSATSVDDIALAAGVAKGSVYYNFGSKSDILEAALTEGGEQRNPFLAQREAAADGGELAAGIRELIEHLRVQAAAIVTLADRLERIAPPG